MALADQAAGAHAFHEFENAQPRTASYTFLSRGILTLCAISCAMLVTGCARNPAQREFDPAVHELKTATAAVRVVPRTRRSSEQHRYAQPRIRRLDPALLTPQSAPDCEYKRSDLETVDSNEWDRLKAEYERQCYQDAEKAARERLNLLQASIQQARD
jgi:hypothetical protein